MNAVGLTEPRRNRRCLARFDPAVWSGAREHMRGSAHLTP